MEEFFAGLEAFEWDAGNSDKSWRKHAVRQAEAEQALLNRPVLVATDVKHSLAETRLVALGRTDAQRDLAVAFTVRGKKVRVISARPMSRAERRIYAEVKTQA